MNDRKRAWQILHKEIVRVSDGTPTDDAWALEMTAILSGADRISDVVLELANFGAIFAVLDCDPEVAKATADNIGAGIMEEPDDLIGYEDDGGFITS